jgi:hypothetical protein
MEEMQEVAAGTSALSVSAERRMQRAAIPAAPEAESAAWEAELEELLKGSAAA